MWRNIWYDLLLDVPELERLTEEQQNLIQEALEVAYDRGFEDGYQEEM